MHSRLLQNKLDDQEMLGFMVKEPRNNDLTTQEQMANLQPSDELIQHYKRKLEIVEKEFDGMFKALQSYKRTCDCQHKLEMDVQRTNKEIGELQSALSDMQMCLLQEKETVLQLRRENEKLTLAVETSLKQPNYVLHHCSKPTEDCLSFKHSMDVTKQMRITSKQESTLTEVKHKDTHAGQPEPRQETYYLKQIQNLKNQMRSQERLAKQQIEALRKDRQVVKEEADACCLRDATKLETLQNRFKRVQDMLYGRTNECLQLRKHVLTCASCDVVPSIEPSPKTCPRRVTGVKSRYMQPQKKTKPSITSVRKTVTSCRVDKEELLKQISYYKRRCQEADQRRKLEAEGFLSDIKELRSKLGKIETLLFKISSDYFGATQNLAFLHIMNQNADHAKKISADLRAVKTKLYSLENDLRHL